MILLLGHLPIISACLLPETLRVISNGESVNGSGFEDICKVDLGPRVQYCGALPENGKWTWGIANEFCRSQGVEQRTRFGFVCAVPAIL